MIIVPELDAKHKAVFVINVISLATIPKRACFDEPMKYIVYEIFENTRVRKTLKLSMLRFFAKNL